MAERSSWPLAMELLTLFGESTEAAADYLVDLSHAEVAGAALWLATFTEAAIGALAEATGSDPAVLVQSLALQLAREAG